MAGAITRSSGGPDMASTEFQENSQNHKLIRKITQDMTRLNSEKFQNFSFEPTFAIMRKKSKQS